MRVLIIRNAYDQDMGGAEQHALNLCIVLREQGIEPLLMTRVPDLLTKAQAAHITAIQGRWHSSQAWGKHYFIRFPLMVLWYIFVLLRYRIDTVHPQGRDDFIFASIAAGILGRPVVWTDHADLKYVLNLSVHPFPYLRKWILFAARFTKSIICVSNAERDKIAAVAPPDFTKKLIVIHNGVFVPTNIKPVVREHNPLIISNARLVPDKGIRELFEALAQLENTSAQLWIIGSLSGNQQKYLALAQKLGIQDRVRLMGYVTHPYEYVAAADLFVHASYHEAFSLAIIEAAMLGKPIVATAVGGAPEMIDNQESGILIPPKDVKALVTAIDFMLSHPEQAQKMGAKAQARAKAEFDFEHIVKQNIIPLYSV